jgi:single-strand DNA-binding protein
MAGSLNKVMLIGNVGRDPDMRYLASGEAVTTFSLATNRRWAGQDGAPREETEWHNVVAWRRLAEQCAEYLVKGRKAYVEGRLQTRSWDDPATGQKRYRTEVVADRMLLLDSRADRPAANGTATGATEGLEESWNPAADDELAMAPTGTARAAS